MRNRLHRRLISVLSLAMVLSSADVFAQDGLEEVPTKPDLSNPDALDLPPMDPFSLTFRPERPADVLDIQDQEACKAQNGKWGTAEKYYDWGSFEHMGTLHLTGCTISNKAQGLWRVTDEKPAPKLVVDDTNATGYAWMKDDKLTGWVVQLHEPKGIVKSLVHYEADEPDGAALFWDELGSLTESVHFKQGKRHGKYETFLESLPTATGEYNSGEPVGVWSFYEEPGMISMRRYYNRQASEDELPADTPKNVKVYWTEWFNGEGVKIIEGYSSLPFGARPSDAGKRVGNMRYYTGTGTLWMDVVYSGTGNVNDNTLFDLCKPYGKKDAPIPAYLDFDSAGIEVRCKNNDEEVYQIIKYYSEGQIWQIMSTLPSGERDGIFREFHPTGEPLAKYYYHNDVPEGEIDYIDTKGERIGDKNAVVSGNGHYVAYWHNGNKREEGNYRMGIKDGMWTTWYQSGTKEGEIEYRMGVQNGVERSWFKNGVVGGERYYRNGSREGIYFGNYSDGRISFKYEFKNDRIINKVYQYTHDGVVESETDYTGSLNPPYPRTYFYNDGKPKASGKVMPGFGEGTRVKEWKFYLKDGTVWKTVEYSNGTPKLPAAELCEIIGGEFMINAENREIGCVAYTVNRETPLARQKRREGYWEWYNEQGHLEKSGSLRLGHLNGEWRYYYVNGKPMLVGSYLIDKRVGKWTGFYEDGIQKFDGSYLDGLETGYWKTYHPGSGDISSEGEFVAGKRHGKWIWRYPGGKIREEGVYEHGVEVGTWTQYHENGQKLGEGQYIDGKREGEWHWWRENGKTWRTAVYAKGREAK